MSIPSVYQLTTNFGNFWLFSKTVCFVSLQIVLWIEWLVARMAFVEISYFLTQFLDSVLQAFDRIFRRVGRWFIVHCFNCDHFCCYRLYPPDAKVRMIRRTNLRKRKQERLFKKLFITVSARNLLRWSPMSLFKSLPFFIYPGPAAPPNIGPRT